ncbi:EamA family transporter [Mangrovitalea sediminis]|uniref:EamA family transporter n=1 Tax=Mangrovitalea sediminis TaxID=1982043 RepID=UPI000BE6125F|nr:EamA family transporter [Mangrovitalea sediminis]
MAFRDVLIALSIVVVWGLSFVVVKWGLSDMPPLFFVTLRFAGVAVLALVLPRPRLPWSHLAAYGLSWGAIQFGALFIAIQVGMPAGLASVVVQSQAFFTLILATFFLNEHWKIQQVVGLLCAAAGLWLIADSPRGEVPLLGFLLNLLGALGWAFGNIIVRRVVQRETRTDNVAFIAWASIIPALVLGALSLGVEGPHRIGASVTHMGLSAWTAVAYQAFGALLFGALMWNRLLSRYPANQVAPFSLLVPCIGLVSCALLLDEKTTAVQLVGTLLVMAGLLVNVAGQRVFGMFMPRRATLEQDG